MMPADRRPFWRWLAGPAGVALLAALLAAIVLGAVGIAAAGQVDRLIARSLKDDIILDRRSLLADSDRLRIVAVVDAVDQRIVGHADAGRPALYLVADARGRMATGNLPAWPAGLPREPGWHSLILPGRGGVGSIAGDRMLVLVEPVASGWWLAVGRSVAPWDRLQHQLALIAAAAGLCALAVAMAVGWVAVRRGQRDVAAMNAALAAFRAGALERRLGRAQADAGLADLAIGVDATMDHVERLLRGMQRLSQTVAHELKSPLSRSDRQLEQGDVPGARAELSGTLQLVDLLLDIAANETAANTGARPCDLAAVVQAVAELYRDVAEAAGVALDAQASPAPALADPDLLTRALANLVDNAIRHSPPGGRVILSSAVGPDGAELAVGDTGPGPPADSVAELMARARPGPRGDGSRSSGLGLRLVQAIALRHGSDVAVRWTGAGHVISINALQPAGTTPPPM
jgi:hypothetical protein